MDGWCVCVCVCVVCVCVCVSTPSSSPFFKKGSRSECDNYRGIALLSIPSKVFACVLLNQIKPRAEAFLHENQCGFRKGRRCTDQLFSLRVIMEKAREYPVYICFVDLRKTYNSVNRSTLWSVSNIATICHQSFSPSSKPCMRTPLLL